MTSTVSPGGDESCAVGAVHGLVDGVAMGEREQQPANLCVPHLGALVVGRDELLAVRENVAAPGRARRRITAQSAPDWASFGVNVVIAAALSPKREDAASREIVHP